MILKDSLLGYDEMRHFVLDVVKNDKFNQYFDIERGVAERLIKFKYSHETNSFNLGYSQSTKVLSDKDSNLVRGIVWDLIIERILRIGLDRSNQAWPFLSVNEEIFNSVFKNDVILYDVDNVLELIKSQIPNIDSIIVGYLKECLNTYRIGATLASSVMLGCATEKAILLLIDSYTDWLEKREEFKESKKFRDSKGKAISKRFDDYVKSFKSHKKDIRECVFENFDIVISSVFNIIRKNRNDSGHPTGKNINRDELSAWIHVFRTHCIKIYDLKNFFEES